ncbi:MAG: sensor histidine kinase, partial [Actinomycetota bacterium]
RLDSRRLQMKLEPVDLPSLTLKLVDQFKSKWGTRNIVVDAPAHLPAVPADESRIEEVLVNLIDNAVKYSPQGGNVTVRMNPVDGHVEVSVEDSGIGIAPEDTAKLFQKFQRIASAETRDIGGTGLGLYIVKGLVEGHGGTVLVQSVPGVGSTFTFTIPVRPDEENGA